MNNLKEKGMFTFSLRYKQNYGHPLWPAVFQELIEDAGSQWNHGIQSADSWTCCKISVWAITTVSGSQEEIWKLSGCHLVHCAPVLQLVYQPCLSSWKILWECCWKSEVKSLLVKYWTLTVFWVPVHLYHRCVLLLNGLQHSPVNSLLRTQQDPLAAVIGSVLSPTAVSRSPDPGEGSGAGFVGLESSFTLRRLHKYPSVPAGRGTQEGSFFHVESLGHKEPQAFLCTIAVLLETRGTHALASVVRNNDIQWTFL